MSKTSIVVLIIKLMFWIIWTNENNRYGKKTRQCIDFKNLFLSISLTQLTTA